MSDRIRDYQHENAVRDLMGVTATLRNISTDERSVVVERDVSSVASRCDALGTDWRVVTLSTRSTILADLQGSRDIQSDPLRGSYVVQPERRMLGSAHRLDLLDPAAFYFGEGDRKDRMRRCARR